jgi:hypothetical protein
MTRVTLVAALILVLATPADASSIAVVITAQAGAPITLTSCTLRKEMMPLARGVSVEGLRTGVVFKNTTLKPIADVAFLFTMRDVSGDVIDSHRLHSKGTYAPNVEIDNINWLSVDSWPTLGDMDCSIDRVVFSDGSAWPT